MPHAITAECAYVLHKRPYRESSLLVDFFSLEYGRISAVWRSARGAKRRVNSEPFRPLRIRCMGRTDLKTLVEAETHSGASAAMLSGKQLYTGLYVNELLHRLLAPHDAHATIFDSYQHLLEVLQAGHNVEPQLRHFELNLLSALGYGVDFESEAGGNAISPSHCYRYVAEAGFQRQQGSMPNGIGGATLLAIAAGNWRVPNALIHLRQITQTALVAQLHGRPLRSAEYFRTQTA